MAAQAGGGDGDRGPSLTLEKFQKTHGWDPWTFGAIMGSYLRRLEPSLGRDFPAKLQALYDAAAELPPPADVTFRDALTMEACWAVAVSETPLSEFRAYLEQVAGVLAPRPAGPPEPVRITHVVAQKTWKEMRYCASVGTAFRDLHPDAPLCGFRVDLPDGLQAYFWVQNSLPSPRPRVSLMMGPETLTETDFLFGEPTTFRRGGKDYVITLEPEDE